MEEVTERARPREDAAGKFAVSVEEQVRKVRHGRGEDIVGEGLLVERKAGEGHTIENFFFSAKLVCFGRSNDRVLVWSRPSVKEASGGNAMETTALCAVAILQHDDIQR